MSDRLQEIRARLEAATPGPWATVTVSGAESELAPRNLDEGLPHTDLFAHQMDVTTEVNEPGLLQARADCRQINVACLVGERRENRELIAHAPEDIAYLLDLVSGGAEGRLRSALGGKVFLLALNLARAAEELKRPPAERREDELMLVEASLAGVRELGALLGGKPE